MERRVEIVGLTPIMFDRFLSKTDVLDAWQKLYYAKDGKTVVFPAENIKSFLSATNTTSAPKRLLSSKEYMKVALGCQSFVMIEPELIPITKNHKPIVLTTALKAEGETDKATGIYVKFSVARLKTGVPHELYRPVIPLPWEMAFKVTLMDNPDVKENKLYDLFDKGGLALGFGTWRGTYGKFKIVLWK